MLSKTKFYLLIVAELGWGLIIIGTATYLLHIFNVDNWFVIAFIFFLVMALTSGWIPTYSYKKYSESKELQEQTEFWKSWKRKKPDTPSK